eukprot:485220_1
MDEIDVLDIHSKLFKNTLFPHSFDLNALENVRSNYEPSDNEIWIVTYPKNGTTLMQQLCHQIMECYYKKTKSNDHIYYKDNNREYNIFEWIDCQAQYPRKWNKFIDATKNSVRFVKTHSTLPLLPCKQLPKKMIIVCRNPKDVCVSFYYHNKNAKFNEFNRDFNVFFTLFVAGLVEVNSYFEWYLKYWKFYKNNLENKNTEILWVYYEDLVSSDESKRNQ